MTEKELKEKFEALLVPFEGTKWRMQSKTKDEKFGLYVAYIDARQVAERLDEVFGAENWSNTYEAETGTSSISLRINGEWVTKTDIGTDSKKDALKGRASDALKRAAVLWGIGRYLYSMGIKKLELRDNYPITAKGDKLYTNEQVSAYLNGMSHGMGLLLQLWKEKTELQEDDEFKELFSSLKKYF